MGQGGGSPGREALAIPATIQVDQEGSPLYKDLRVDFRIPILPPRTSSHSGRGEKDNGKVHSD